MNYKLFIAGFLLCALFLFFGCTGQGLVDANTSIPLKDIEVKDYNGQNLSSVNDFRENSILGPQYINISNYSLQITGLVETPKSYSYSDINKSFQSYSFWEPTVVVHTKTDKLV